MTWPTQAAVLSGTSIYGNPRNRKDPSRPSATWEAANIVTITPPFRMTYDGKPVKVIRVNKNCAESLLRVLNRLLDAARKINPKNPQAVLDESGASIFGGCVMYRLMRDGKALSIHSWGAAIDLDPARNSLYDKTPNFTRYPWVIEAFKAEGWRWGGDWNGNGSSADERKADGMHFQATA